jgi:hypothetical protein
MLPQGSLSQGEYQDEYQGEYQGEYQDEDDGFVHAEL